MLTRIAIGAVIGLVAGGAIGYLGRCRNGQCPLTSDPFLGAVLGAVLGALLSYSMVGSQMNPRELALGATATTEQEFQTQVLQADKPVLVDFYATWCMPCKVLAPTIDAIAKDYEGKAHVVKIDIDKAKGLAAAQGVRAVPTVMLYHQGKKINTWVGAQKADVYRQALDKELASAPAAARTEDAAAPPTKGNEPMAIAAATQRTVNFKGNPLTLLGKSVQVGQEAPDFTVLTNDLKPASLADYKGKVIILATVPSLDTKVCDVETRRFNQEAASLNKDIVVLTVSMDLPFAQARWCGAAGIDRVVTLSDHREGSLGTSYGVLIKELRLLSRAVFVIGRDGKIVHIQMLDEITNEPNYQAALDAAKKAV